MLFSKHLFDFMGVKLEAKKRGCGSLISSVDLTASRTALCTSYLASAWGLEFFQSSFSGLLKS